MNNDTRYKWLVSQEKWHAAKVGEWHKSQVGYYATRAAMLTFTKTVSRIVQSQRSQFMNNLTTANTFLDKFKAKSD